MAVVETDKQWTKWKKIKAAHHELEKVDGKTGGQEDELGTLHKLSDHPGKSEAAADMEINPDFHYIQKGKWEW